MLRLCIPLSLPLAAIAVFASSLFAAPGRHKPPPRRKAMCQNTWRACP